jgi:hypothetical protein
LPDFFELTSFLLMFYAAGISFYIAKRAVIVGRRYLFLSLLLAFMVLSHGIHHLFTFLQYVDLEQVFEFAASVFALALALEYVYVSRRP